MENIIAKVTEFGTLYGIKIIGSILIFIIGKWISKVIVRFTQRLMLKAKVDETLTKFLANLMNVLLLIVVVLAALNSLGVNTTSLVAILGAAGLAIGLALQGTLSNFGAGVLLIIFKPFMVGDFIDAGGAMGVVEEINIFNTKFKTPDNKVIIVPNASIIGGNITNFSAKDTRRVDLTFGAGYGDDLRRVKEELMNIITEEKRVLNDPEPFVAVSELADSSVNFLVRIWVSSSDYWAVYFDMIEKVKLRFDEKDISIPFPQQDVHLFKESES
jgi:small conductance mechanosensitive channel